MTNHLERQLKKLENLFIKYTVLVEENFSSSVKALIEGDADTAKSVNKRDHEIDAAEIEIEEECLKILALYQPVAKDLRYIISILKINNDLERVGDLSSNISGSVIALIDKGKDPAAFLIPQICKAVEKMLKDSLDCVLKEDTELARSVLIQDAEVDDMHKKMYKLVGEEIKKTPENYPDLVQYISISRFLERIADHATNIAEDLIYMIQAIIIRHDKSYESLPEEE